VHARSHEAEQIADDLIDESRQVFYTFARHVPELANDFEEALGFRSRSQGNPQVPSKLQWRAERISLDDIRFHRERRAAQLIEHGA
jgi:hypothetical protein